MRNKQQHTIQTLIRNWLKGDSSAYKSLTQKGTNNDDPFLKDAIDGYESNESNHLERLNRLDDRLRDRIGSKKKNRVVFLMQRAAAVAAILLMVFGSFWWLNNSFDTNESPVAFQQEKTATSDIEKGIIPQKEEDLVAVIQKDETEKSDQIIETKPSKKQSPPTKPNKKSRSIEKVIASTSQKAKEEVVEIVVQNNEVVANSDNGNGNIQDQIEPTESPVIVQSDIVEESEIDVFVDEEPQVYASAPAVVYEESATISISAYPEEEVYASSSISISADIAMAEPLTDTIYTRVNGVVVDAEGEPVFGASIVEINTNNGMMTDFDGRFEIELTDLENPILVSYIGFKEVIQIARLDTINRFVLEQAVDLEQVTVGSYKVIDRDSVFQYLDTDISVYPKDGYEQFYKYLDDALLYPQSAVAKQVEGVVRLRFEIDANGAPQNVEIQESVGYGCDEEAVRLLREGPNWKTKEGETTTNLSIQFKLKENEEKTKKKDGN